MSMKMIKIAILNYIMIKIIYSNKYPPEHWDNQLIF